MHQSPIQCCSKYRIEAQIAEILGDDNRWFCSQHHDREVTDPETLALYFCRQGGAGDFARRWNDAMGRDNRWFCSEMYNQPITDEQILWEYYMAHYNQADHASKRKPVMSEA